MATDLTFANDVTDEAMAALMEKVVEVLGEGEREIRLFLTTYGGELSAAFSFYDRLRLLKRQFPILSFEVVATGYCLSAGTLVLQAGTSRIAYPHTVFMLHQPCQYTSNTENQTITREDMLARVDLQDVLVGLLTDIYATHCHPQGMAVPEVAPFWRARFSSMRQEFFDPTAALALGLIDRVESVR